METDILKQIQIKLDEVEAKFGVKILHAVESGSRAWGFASPDSDYDVRFIYVHPQSAYLRLDPQKDYIDWELNETLDINGWDLKKVLQHFYKSNATLYEWSNSPIVYRTTEQWHTVKAAAGIYFSCKACMYHYLGTAMKNYETYLKDDMVKYKKYFYVLRPILACQWIDQKQSPPPVLFSELAESVLEDEMKPVVNQLLQAKIKMVESEKGPRIDVLNDYIIRKIQYYKEKTAALDDDRCYEWSVLNNLFQAVLREI